MLSIKIFFLTIYNCWILIKLFLSKCTKIINAYRLAKFIETLDKHNKPSISRDKIFPSIYKEWIYPNPWKRAPISAPTPIDTRRLAKSPAGIRDWQYKVKLRDDTLHVVPVLLLILNVLALTSTHFVNS